MTDKQTGVRAVRAEVNMRTRSRLWVAGGRGLHMKQWVRLAVGFAGLAAGYEVGSLLAPVLGRIGFWIVALATMFAVAGIADQIARRFFRTQL